MDNTQGRGDLRLSIPWVTRCGLLFRNPGGQRRLAGREFLERGGYGIVLGGRLRSGHVPGHGFQLGLRRGRVFRPMRKNGDAGPMREDVASPIICAIGEAAKIVVAKRPGRPKRGKKKPHRPPVGTTPGQDPTPGPPMPAAAPQPQERVKYASAHDLRRSFGARWAKKVMPAVLMELMRHANINTTMKYYATRNAETTAELLWTAHEAARANTQPETATPRNDTSRC